MPRKTAGGRQPVLTRKLFQDFDLSRTPGFLLRRCHQRSREVFDAIMGVHGLTRQQTAFLIVVLQNPGASLQDLADLSGTDRNTVTGIVSRLSERGLLRKKRRPTYPRAYEIKLSRTALALLRRMEKEVRAVQDAILAPLSEYERRDFIRLAHKLADEENE